MCNYCEGRYGYKKELMYKNNSDYVIKLNDCNYLEENRTGGYKDSIYGIKLNYCPMCGEKLGVYVKNK